MSEKEKNKICLVSRRFDEDSGRCEWVYAERLKEEMERRNFNVFKIEQENAEINTSPFKKIFHDYFIVLFELLNKRFSEKIRIFHFLNENQAVYSWLIRLTGAKTITTFHDFINLNSKDKKRRIYFKFIYKLASLSDIVIFNSMKTKEEFWKLYGLDKKNYLIPVINYSVFPIENKNKTIRKIGFLGVREPRKNVLEFVKLAKLIKNKKSRFKIDLWGARGSLEEELIKQIKEKELGEIIEIKGIAPGKKINEIFNSFDFLFSPTKEEGLGVALIEPMFCGVPVFILENSKIPEEVKKCCIICKNTEEVFDRISKISRKDYEILVNKSLSNSEKFIQFNAKNNFEKLAKLYNELI